MRRILRVDVGTGTLQWQDLPEEWKLLGGRALTSVIVSSEVDATIDPLGPGKLQNRIIG